MLTNDDSMDIDLMHSFEFVDPALPRGFVAGYCDVLRPNEVEHLHVLFPQKLLTAGAQRKCEFLTGRLLLKKLLLRLNLSPQFPLPADEDGVPVLPDGLIGSLSHTSRIAFAIVGEASFGSIGCDIEPVFSPEMLLDVRGEILNEREEKLLAGLDQRVYGTLVFSGKESLYKAIFPKIRTFLEFSAFEVTKIDTSSLVFKTTTPLNGVPRELVVHFAIKDQFVATWTRLN